MAGTLERIADALESIAASLANQKPVTVVNKMDTKPADKPAKEEKSADKPATSSKSEEDAPSLDDLVAALQAYMKANGRDAAVELLGKYDAKRASDVAEDKRADFISEASS